MCVAVAVAETWALSALSASTRGLFADVGRGSLLCRKNVEAA